MNRIVILIGLSPSPGDQSLRVGRDRPNHSDLPDWMIIIFTW